LVVFYRSCRCVGCHVTDVAVSGRRLVLWTGAPRVGPAITVIALEMLGISSPGRCCGDARPQGASRSRAASQMWLIGGVFGSRGWVSTNVVFMFVLFGSAAEKAGAGGISSSWRFRFWADFAAAGQAAVAASGMPG
jgi:TRAP-type uncharacterized transport system fused permease subunit